MHPRCHIFFQDTPLSLSPEQQAVDHPSGKPKRKSTDMCWHLSSVSSGTFGKHPIVPSTSSATSCTWRTLISEVLRTLLESTSESCLQGSQHSLQDSPPHTPVSQCSLAHPCMNLPMSQTLRLSSWPFSRILASLRWVTCLPSLCPRRNPRSPPPCSTVPKPCHLRSGFKEEKVS